MTTACSSATRAAPADVLSRATVLVADDHDANLVLMQRILAHAGVGRVHTTRAADDVLALYRDVQPDIVLLDLHMPGMNGVAVMHAIRRATPPGVFVPIMFLTADATTEARNHVLEAGANDFLTKPVDRGEVVLRVRNLLHTRALHDQLRAHNIVLETEIAERDANDARARAAHAALTEQIHRAVDGDFLHMVFQPVVDLATGDTVAFEALARFDTQPVRPPDSWFADAARVGLATDLELAAVRRALDRLPDLPRHAALTLNVSPDSAMAPALADLVAASDPQRLILEITEHAAVDDYDTLARVLGGLRQTGVRVAVDDAGAGYASLHHILRLHPDIIKLDIALVRDIHDDPVKRALASSLVAFARDIDATITAEGIETADEHRTLVDLGIPWGQGYLLARPAPLTES
jgi:EAL domain-containing protein (putative c-di-GMP-specific phosphodiesterase class I)/DNA-binding response OmpR family regulator